MTSSIPGLIRLSARIAGFFIAFIALYAALGIVAALTGGPESLGDLIAVAVAAAACLLLWRIAPWGDNPFNRPGSRAAAVICCVAVLAALAVRWPSLGPALGGAVLAALISAILEELVVRWAPVVFLKRAGRSDMPALVTAGAISTGAFVFLHQNTDPWLVADKVTFAVVAFYLALLTANALLPVLLHLASNLLLETALQTGLVKESAALLALDFLLMGLFRIESVVSAAV